MAGTAAPTSIDHMVKMVGAAPARGEAARERILDAAHRVFVRRGTVGGRTQEIADEAGVPKALLHYHFGTKQALADAVLERNLGAFLPPVFLLIADGSRPFDARLRDLVARYVAFHTEHPYVAPYVVGELHADPARVLRLLPAHAPDALRALDRELAAAARRGERRPVPARHFVLHLMGMIMFPFLARPLVAHLLGLDDAGVAALLRERAHAIPEFVLAGMRP